MSVWSNLSGMSALIRLPRLPRLSAQSLRLFPAILSVPFAIVDFDKTVPLTSVVHLDGAHAVIKKQTHVQEIAGKAWYVVNTSKWKDVPSFVRGSGLMSEYVEGKFAVMQLDDAAAERLSGELHSSGMACGVLTRLSNATVNMAPAVTPVPLRPVDTEIAAVTAMAGAIDANKIKAIIDEMSQITTRFHSTPTGISVSDWLVGKYRDLAAGRSDIEISKYDHTAMNSRQASVVVRITGTKFPEEILITGSHIDSVNWEDGTKLRSPGVDDNASGTATNLEVFRVLMANGAKFERTVEIHGYAAEEIGLVGSLHMSNDYKAANKRVIAMVQQDMNLYKEPGTPDKIWFVEENTDDGFNNLLGLLVDKYVKIAWGKGSLTAGSSDHASWRRRGYATSFPFEHPQDHNPHIHTADDTTANANAFTQSAAFGKLGLAYLAHFGGLR